MMLCGGWDVAIQQKNFEYLSVFMGEWFVFKVRNDTGSFSVVWFLDIVCMNASLLKPTFLSLHVHSNNLNSAHQSLQGKQKRTEMKL